MLKNRPLIISANLELCDDSTPERQLWVAVLSLVEQDLSLLVKKFDRWKFSVKTNRTPRDLVLLRVLDEIGRFVGPINQSAFRVVCENAGISHSSVLRKVNGDLKEALEMRRDPFIQECYQKRFEDSLRLKVSYLHI